jgi:hypothetical protein
MNSRLNTLLGMTTLCTPRWLGLARIVEFFKISAYSTKALLKDFDETCSTRNVLDMIEWKSHGTGNDNVCHFGCMAWGCPWLGSLVGLLLHGSFSFSFSFLMWRCGMSEGFRLPSKWAYLPWFLMHLALAFWPLS